MVLLGRLDTAGQTSIAHSHQEPLRASEGPLKQLPIVLNTENASITHWHLAHFPSYGRDYPQ